MSYTNWGKYSVVIDAANISTSVDLFRLKLRTSSPISGIRLCGLEIGQTSDVTDAQDEVLQLRIFYSTGTSGTSTAQPLQTDAGGLSIFNTPADVAANQSATVPGGSGALICTTWNVRAGYINWWPEDCRPSLLPGNSASYTCMIIGMSAPVDTITLSATVYFEAMQF